MKAIFYDREKNEHIFIEDVKKIKASLIETYRVYYDNGYTSFKKNRFLLDSVLNDKEMDW
jgi:hypothetical protein